MLRLHRQWRDRPLAVNGFRRLSNEGTHGLHLEFALWYFTTAYDVNLFIRERLLIEAAVLLTGTKEVGDVIHPVLKFAPIPGCATYGGV